MWGLPFYETFSKLYLNIYIRYIKLFSVKLSFKIPNIIGNVIVLVIMQTKKSFYLLFVDF